MDTVASLGLTEVPILASSSKTIFKALVSTTGQMVESTTDYGSITKWKDMEFSHGQTVEDMKASISTIRKRVKVFSTGLMEEDTKVAGKMESNTDLAPTLQLVGKPNKESGKRVKDSIGLRMSNSDQ